MTMWRLFCHNKQKFSKSHFNAPFANDSIRFCFSPKSWSKHWHLFYLVLRERFLYVCSALGLSFTSLLFLCDCNLCHASESLLCYRKWKGLHLLCFVDRSQSQKPDSSHYCGTSNFLITKAKHLWTVVFLIFDYLTTSSPESMSLLFYNSLR